MQLGVSSDADPQATLAELGAACLRRGLAALELRVRDDGTATDMLRQALAREAQESPRIAGLLGSSAALQPLADLAATLRAPLVVEAADHAGALQGANRLAALGATALPLMTGRAAEWLPAVAASGQDFAWQIDDAVADPAADVARMLEQGAAPAYIRLVGGGPEAVMQHGRGVGAVMRHLALAGYAGPLILTPSSRRYRVAWSVWLGRRGSWGCGSAGGSDTTLSAEPSTTLTRAES
jgi:hypothetical protein